MHKEAYLLFFGFASAVDFEFGETEQDTIDTLVKAYNEAPEEWKPELLAAGPEYLRIAITGEKDKSIWPPFVPDFHKDPDYLFSILQQGKQVVFIRQHEKQMFRIFQSAHTDEVYLVSIVSGDIPAINSYRYDDIRQKKQIERLLSCSSYDIFETEEEAMKSMILKRHEMNEEA